MRLVRCCLLALLALVPATASGADPRRAWHVAADNDYFNFWQCPACRPDYGYTHGAEVAVHSPGVPRFIARLAPRRLVASDSSGAHPWLVLGLRQEIYTPWRASGDRPAAGWLELNVGVRNETPRSLRSARLRIGVTGPPSLAERTQSWFHHAFGFFQRRDWDHQLPFEPGIALQYESARQALQLGPAGGLRVGAGPQWRARLGTFVVDGTAGAHVVAGLRPSPPWRQSDRAGEGPSLYLMAAARVDAIGRNEFLDGTLFRPGPGIDRYTMVPEIEWGAGAQLRRFRLEWRAIRRGKEFPAQPMPHSYSTIAISVLP